MPKKVILLCPALLSATYCPCLPLRDGNSDSALESNILSVGRVRRRTEVRTFDLSSLSCRWQGLGSEIVCVSHGRRHCSPSLPQLRSHGRAGRVQREERKPDGTQRTVCSFIWNIKTYHGAAAPLRNRPFYA